MEIRETDLDGVVELLPTRHGDERGWFSEVWNQATIRELDIDIDWVQHNEAMSYAPGTIRGLHFQMPPHAQAKLVRSAQGRLLDVAVDLRRSSPTFGSSVSVELSAELGNQLLVPVGFGHGYCTLEPSTVIAYKVSDFYSPITDRALRWNDPELAIDWPVGPDAAVLSEHDRQAPLLDQLDDSLFD